jgi:catalase
MSSTKKPLSKTQRLTMGSCGELHQTTSAPDSRFTTNHGVPVSDDQNSLKAGILAKVDDMRASNLSRR